MNSKEVFENVPKTLSQWRKSGWEPPYEHPRDVWNPLEPFLQSKRLHLWKTPGLVPGTDLPTLYNENIYISPITMKRSISESRYFMGRTACLCAASTNENRFVVIRLIKKGNDGALHLKVLHRVAFPDATEAPGNHCVPVLQELQLGDMVFAVFPFLGDMYPDERMLYANLKEVLESSIDFTEGIAFLHENLVAHLDIAQDNFLLNSTGSPYPRGYRSLFPMRNFINDFELSVCFDFDSSPESRTVVGTPLPPEFASGNYTREMAPEMNLSKPYCPFKTDIWQLGRMFEDLFGWLNEICPQLTDVISKMQAEDPNERPTAKEALAHFRTILSELSSDQLTLDLPVPLPLPPLPPSPETAKALAELAELEKERDLTPLVG